MGHGRSRGGGVEEVVMAQWLFARCRMAGALVEVERRLIDDLPVLRQAATGVAATDPAGDSSFVIDLPGHFRPPRCSALA